MTKHTEEIAEIKKRLDALEGQKPAGTVETVGVEGESLTPWKDYFADLDNWPDWATSAYCNEWGWFFHGKDRSGEGCVRVAQIGAALTPRPVPANSLIVRPERKTPTKHDPNYKPEKGEIYWTYDGWADVCSIRSEDSEEDRQRHALGLCFKEKEHAEAAVRKRKAMVAAERHAARCDWSEAKFARLPYRRLDGEVDLATSLVALMHSFGLPTWPSKELWQNFLKNDPHGPDYVAMLKGEL